MRSGLVVVKPQSGNGKTDLFRGFKPVLVQALVLKRTVKALDVCVLRRAAGHDKNMLDAVILRSGNKCPASDFQSVSVLTARGVAPKQCCCPEDGSRNARQYQSRP